METVLIVAVIAVAFWVSWMVSSAAGKKGRSESGFFWLSLLLFPLGAIVAAFIIAATKPLLPEETKVFERQKLVQYTPRLGKIMGGSDDNRPIYNLDKWRELDAVTQVQADSQRQWQERVFREMVDLKVLAAEKIDKALSGDIVEAGRIDQKFAKLKRQSSEFAQFVRRLDADITPEQPPVQEPASRNILRQGQPDSTAKDASELDMAGDMEKLAALRKEGLLSEEEFTEAKRRLLDR